MQCEVFQIIVARGIAPKRKAGWWCHLEGKMSTIGQYIHTQSVLQPRWSVVLHITNTSQPKAAATSVPQPVTAMGPVRFTLHTGTI